MTRPVIVELFEAIVQSVSDAMPYDVHFQQGHMLEIINTVKEMSADPDTDKRYPLIAFQHDVTEQETDKGTEFEVTLFIVTITDPLYTSKQRSELNFKPVLTPVYNEFINQIVRSGYFDEHTELQVRKAHKKINHLFWGNSGVMGNEANIFGDAVDCIEVKGLKLTANSSGCYITPNAPKLLEAFTDTTGNFAYLRFNQEMNDPTGNEAHVIINGTTVNSLTLSGNIKIIIGNMETVEYGDNVTVTLDALQSVDDIAINATYDFPVTNNTFQLT